MKSNILPALEGVRRKFWNGCVAALTHLPKIVLNRKKKKIGLPQLVPVAKHT